MGKEPSQSWPELGGPRKEREEGRGWVGRREGGGVDGGGSLVCGGEGVWGGRERIPREGREAGRGSGGQAHLWRRWMASLVDRRLQVSRGSAARLAG